MSSPNPHPTGWLGRWNALPLYVRILIALLLGLLTGLVLGPRALVFEMPSKVILQLLGALAPPLILVAVTHVLMTTEVSGKMAGRLAGLGFWALLIGAAIGVLYSPRSGRELRAEIRNTIIDLLNKILPA